MMNDLSKKTLFVGSYRNTSGWGVAALMYLKAAYKAGIPYSCRPLITNYYEGEMPPFVKASEKVKFDEYSNVVQICFPHLFMKIPNYKSIGICFLETTSMFKYPECPWLPGIKAMDEIWVSTKHEHKFLVEEMGVNAHFIPQPCDLWQYQKNRKELKSSIPKGFNFYYIGGLEERKNLTTLIKAFLTEFTKDDKVNLIIKTSKWYSEKILERSKEVKKTIRFKKDMPNVFIIDNQYSDEEMLQFHYSNDCLVMPSSSECPSRPVIDAIGMGKLTLVTDNTSMCDLPVYAKINSYEDYCNCYKPPGEFLYTARDTWQIPVVKDLCAKMRMIYETNKEKNYKIDEDISFYGLENVGNLMKCQLLT